MGKISKAHKHITGRVEILELPEITQLLEGMKLNRPRTESHVMFLADQMMAGEWRITGEPIVIGVSGRLLDGQNRCAAALVAEKPLVTMVVRGVDDKEFHSMGTGKPRSLRDVLAIGKEANAAALASSLSWLWRYNRDAMLVAAKTAGFTHKRALNLLRRHNGLRDSVLTVRSTWAQDIGLFSGHATLHYLYRQINAKKADKFFALLSPEGHTAGRQNPANVLVAWLLKHVIRSVRRPAPLEVMAVSVKAMRAYFEGKRLTRLLWVQSGDRAEDFPALLSDMESHGPRQRQRSK